MSWPEARPLAKEPRREGAAEGGWEVLGEGRADMVKADLVKTDILDTWRTMWVVSVKGGEEDLSMDG